MATFRRLAELGSRDEAFALHAGENLPIGELGLVDYVCILSPTLAEAMANLARYFHLVAQTAFELSFHSEADLGRIEARFCGLADPQTRWLERQSAEFTFAAIVSRARQATDQPIVPERVTFRHNRPTYSQECSRIFSAPVKYSSSTNQLLFTDRTLALVPRARDLRLYHLLRGFADAALASIPAKASTADRVLRALAEESQPSRKSLRVVAQRLHVSARTLHRQLEAEETSFARLRDAHLRELAESCLHDPSKTIADISYRLGFSEPSAFHRAFKRWLGLSPQRYRRERLSAQRKSSRSSR